jgi:hypothetical protein
MSPGNQDDVASLYAVSEFVSDLSVTHIGGWVAHKSHFVFADNAYPLLNARVVHYIWRYNPE